MHSRIQAPRPALLRCAATSKVGGIEIGIQSWSAQALSAEEMGTRMHDAARHGHDKDILHLLSAGAAVDFKSVWVMICCVCVCNMRPAEKLSLRAVSAHANCHHRSIMTTSKSEATMHTTLLPRNSSIPTSRSHSAPCLHSRSDPHLPPPPPSNSPPFLYPCSPSHPGSMDVATLCSTARQSRGVWYTPDPVTCPPRVALKTRKRLSHAGLTSDPCE
jgi:hypothetical protein